MEKLYEGSRTIVYRAIESSQQRPVIIKLLNQEFPSFNEILQFRNQYTITKGFNSPGVVRLYKLEICCDRDALIMEDFGSMSLREWIKHEKLDCSGVLAIAVQIAEILHDLNQHQIVHKDIKPANILIHPESKQVKLIDFSIASLLPKETQELQNPNVLEGTLAYLAPEQTGRMNRGIDYRTDFYGLGVTLYELLTDQLPFQSDDPLELIHYHIAKALQPPHQINSAIPTALSAMQNATGLPASL